MEKRIKGHTGWYLRYDPEKAKLCAEDNGIRLYRKKTGEYFLAAGESIIPLEYDDAAKWVMEHLPDKYDRLFGKIGQTAEKKNVLISMSASTAERLKRASGKTKKTQSALVEMLINKYL